MAIVFNTSRPSAVVNRLHLSTLADLTLDNRPVGMPVSESHLVMAFANALAQLGIHIGHGKGEVAPEDALEALRKGIVTMRADAEKALREQAAAT